MNRKEFLKKSMTGLGIISLIPLISSCGKEEEMEVIDTGTGTGSGSGDCLTSPAETEGPFPTKNPSSLEMMDIRSDRTGVPMIASILIADANNDCAPITDAIVDIWHCDKDGYYSEYGGVGLQQADFTDVSFLRGRQVTDAEGKVNFQTIFPGWYRGRATHIHVHVYDSNGNSLLVTQIAFPEDVAKTVHTTATDFYTDGEQDTTNSTDNVFGDGVEAQLATVEGNISEGYTLTHTIAI